MTSVRWKLAWLLVLPIMSLDRTAMTVAAPIIQKDMHFTLAQMSWILTAFHWAYAVSSIPAGIFTAWAGARVALLIANAAWSALTLAIPFAGSAASLIGLRFALGGFQAVDMPASVTAFRHWFPLSERARANAALLTGVYLGPIIGAPLTIWLVSGIVSALAWWLLFRDKPEAHAGVSDSERALIAAGQGETVRDKASTWSTIQEIGGDDTSILTAWNGMLTNGAAALGPLLMANLVTAQGGSWSGALAAMALPGAATWTVIHVRGGAVAAQAAQ